MPSTRHELPLLLLREQPEVLGTVLEHAFGLKLASPLVEASASFAEISPAAYAADLVLVCDEAAVVVEAQNRPDELKRLRWPLYTASAHATHARPTWLVVVALDDKVARWAERPIRTFQGGAFVPWVVGPAQIPRIEDLDVARAHPELAVLSALAHGHGQAGISVAVAALAASGAVEQRDEDRGKLYFDAVMAAAGDVARVALEAIMKTEGYEYQSEFARKYVAQGIAQGIVEGREEGREEGLRIAVRQVCFGLGITWSAEREAAVANLDAPALEALCATLVTTRRWPD